MIFNSFTFLLFFIAVTLLYFLFPQKYRWGLLLVASYIFYMAWDVRLIVLLIFSTAINYLLGHAIYQCHEEKGKKRLLLVCLIVNFSLLFVFKYFMFFQDTIFSIFGSNGSYPFSEVSIVLPMGISFYTFQATAYVVDVYRGDIVPVRHYGRFSLFISFFPQLVAGPIERSKDLLPQFEEKHKVDLQRISLGLKIMLFGFFKKMVIADRVAVAVNTIYNTPGSYSGLYFILATFLFAFQIYCDFSGYSDIAVGAAKVLGFDLTKNFKSPYLAQSLRGFWQRWHISLSTWFKDYVYIPLGGNREGKKKQYRNLIITFVVSGLWHGANWTFLLWGGIHGILQVFGLITLKLRNGIKKVLHLEGTVIMKSIGCLFTFALVLFAWVFFRANTIGDAFYILSNFFEGLIFTKDYWYTVLSSMGMTLMEVLIALGAILFLLFMELISGKRQVYEFMERRNLVLRFLFYLFLAWAVLSLGVYYDAGQFIYFQF